MKSLLGVFLVLGYGALQAAEIQNRPSIGVLFENVRIFDGRSEQLLAPSNVLVVGNVIITISTAPIAIPSGLEVTRFNGDWKRFRA
jgi:hypothetical protein